MFVQYDLFIFFGIVMHKYFILKLEILGLDPKITICKIAVLPIKLYPLKENITLKAQAGFEPARLTVKMLRLNHLTIGP